MHPASGIVKVEDHTDHGSSAGEMISSPVTPTYGLGFLSSESGTYQPPQYITPESLNRTDLDPVIFDDYSHSTTSIQPQVSSLVGYGLSTLPQTNWTEPSYFSEATSTASFPATDPFSGHDSMLPVAVAGNHGLFPLTSELGTGSYSVPPMAIYSGRSDQSPATSSDYIRGKLLDTRRIRGPMQMSKRRLSPSSPGVARSTGSILEVAGETAFDSRSANKIQLRTAYRKAKSKRQPSQSSTESGKKSGHEEEEEEQEDPLTHEERRARHSHNIVEKQYRNRLNAQFVRLLAVIPAEQRNGSSGEDGTISDNLAPEDKRVSKAEVLDLATRRIRALEEERARLEEENSMLVGSVDALTGAAVTRGLGKME